ncbi:MAG: ABC transporter ATP-binding protein [Desulfovibrio aminophilus]|uniref:ABC transporter ATP-binding protein n=1 Tax=Desulfovibrio aminophilus TaxID=81425 RepID=UPI0039E7E0EC
MLRAIDIAKTFRSGGLDAPALRGVSQDVPEGRFIAVVGRSGSGKSTLLNVLSTLTRPDAGGLTWRGADLADLPESAIDALRRRDFAVIFQQHHLLPYLTALENTLLPFMTGFRSVSGAQRDRARACLARVGLSGKENRLPGALSGGEQQRVAIARALVKDARVLFADEPTGSLDKATGRGVMELLRALADGGLAVVMVTHDQEWAALADEIVFMEDGRLRRTLEDG